MKKNVLFFIILFCLVGTYSTIYAQTKKEIIIEGTLRMYLLSNTGDVKLVSQYRKTDYRNEYLAFVVKTQKKVNVAPYLDEGGKEILGNDDMYHSSFMLGQGFPYGADFAQKYANKRVRVRATLYVPGGSWRKATAVVLKVKGIKLVEDSQSSQRRAGDNHVVQKPANMIDITGMWSCVSKEVVEDASGEKMPSWTFDLKLKVENNQIRGDYLVFLPLHLWTDGNLHSPGGDSFDIRGKWNGDRYIVKYQSSRDADVTAYIKPISSQKIEWGVISVKGGCSFAPEKAILTKER